MHKHYKPPECPECPEEHRGQEAEWRRGFLEEHYKHWSKGYAKGGAVRKALKRYASGGRVELLERAIKANSNG